MKFEISNGKLEREFARLSIDANSIDTAKEHYTLYVFIMVALWNRADHCIFMLWFVLSSFFPRLISAAADWMSAILPHMVWP